MLALVGLFQVLGRFVLCSLGIVTGALRELVFVHRALSLAGDVEDVAEIDVRPDFRLFWLDTVLAVDPNQPVAAIRTVEGWIAQESSAHRSLAHVRAVFAGVVLALVAIGVYGTLSYIAALRRQEVGVRMCRLRLGPSRRR